MSIGDDNHDAIMAEFRKYFDLNQKWATEKTHASARRLRSSLSEIRRLCTDQRKLIQEWRYDNFAPQNASKAALKRIEEKANQNQKGKEVDDDN